MPTLGFCRRRIKISNTVLRAVVGCGLTAFICFNGLSSHLKSHKSDSREVSASRRQNTASYIIYRCLRNDMCGGLADRQKGIVISYLIAKVLGRKFGIQIENPCDIQQFLQPNEVDWIVPAEAHKLKSEFWFKTDCNSFYFRDNLTFLDLNEELKSPTTYITANIEYVRFLKKNPHHISQLGWAANATFDQVYAKVLRKLFRFKKPLQTELMKFFNSIPRDRSLICAQIRMGRNPTIPDDSETRNNESSIQGIWKFLQNFNDLTKYRLFVSTDSKLIEDESLRRFPNVMVNIPGWIAHIDRNSSRSCEGLRKVILDQEVLSHCHTLLVTNSGVGRIAAFLRTKQDNLYCAAQNIVVKCNFTSENFMSHIW